MNKPQTLEDKTPRFELYMSPYCSHCQSAEKKLADLGYDYTARVMNIKEGEDTEIWDAFEKKFGIRKVPLLIDKLNPGSPVVKKELEEILPYLNGLKKSQS